MGKILPFAAAHPNYPPSATLLDAAEQVFLFAVRWWVAAFRRGADPMPPVWRSLTTAGAPGAALSIDALMTIMACTAQQPIAIHCPRCPNLSKDEKHLIHAASLAQANQRHLAERVLRTALLSAQGAEFALGPLDGLGVLFVDARLIFRRRRSLAEVTSSTVH